MKQYVIDELRADDAKSVKAYLDDTFGPAAMGSVYWIQLPDNILSDIQKEHTACQPFFFAADLGATRLSCEFLVRTQNAIRCHCVGYATPLQREWLMAQIDAVFEKLDIIT
mgnify:CR=1 FL=1